MISKDGRHFRRRLEVQLLLIAQAALVIHVRARPDADEHIMRFVTFPREEMDVVGCDQSHAELLRHARQRLIDAQLLGDPMILHFQEVVLLPENVSILRGQLHRGCFLVRRDGVRHLPFQAATEADQASGMPGEQRLVDPRLVIHPVEVRRGDELQKVVVSHEVLGQQREMERRLALARRLFLQVRSWRHVYLAPHQRLDPGFLRLLVKLDRTVHHAVVGHSHRGHLVLLRLVHDVFHPRRPVQRRVLRVEMQVDEGIGGHGRER